MNLKVNSITKNFGNKEVLKGISFSAQGGKALGLLGRNGAGKTTAIRIIMGVFPSDSGEVLYDGKPADKGKVRVGYLPEERGLYPRKVIIEQLVYLAALKGISKNDAKKDIMNILGRLGMADTAKLKLETLSKGNQQKIQLAATLLGSPDLIILDEPFSGLDPVNAMLLKDIVKEEIAKGKTVLFSSHQMNYIEEFCEDIIIINKGEVAVEGAIRDIKRSYDRSRFVISTPDCRRAAEALQPLLSERLVSMETVGGELYLNMKSAEDKRLVFSALASAADIDAIRVFEPSLNDIFVDYTEDSI